MIYKNQMIQPNRCDYIATSAVAGRPLLINSLMLIFSYLHFTAELTVVAINARANRLCRMMFAVKVTFASVLCGVYHQWVLSN